MIVTFRLYGQGFRPESVVLAGSTVVGESGVPMEIVLTSRYVSPTVLEVDIDSDRFPDALIHVSVMQTPDGVRSATTTLNPRLAPTRPKLPVDGGVLAHHADTLTLHAFAPGILGLAPDDAYHDHVVAPMGLGPPHITANVPNPVKLATKATDVQFQGTGFAVGCTFALTGPSGAQNGVCSAVSPTQAKASIIPNTAGTHQMVITNPPPGVASNSWSFQVS